MVKNKSTWKECEREIARRLGGTRVPVSGRARGSAPDIEHLEYSIEVKHREKLPQWLHSAFEQADMSKLVGQLPMVILHEQRQRYDDCYVIVRLADVERFLAKAQPLKVED